LLQAPVIEGNSLYVEQAGIGIEHEEAMVALPIGFRTIQLKSYCLTAALMLTVHLVVSDVTRRTDTEQSQCQN